ncbi:MBL fold metallo-hydrolase [Leptolyngbya sp. AN02str]|uniref:MBL fold metallo-hydrolase n=1 Tax=Leptolyngbya sp. AN02str TaxID=3423363 RepID=UPI003D318BD0
MKRRHFLYAGAGLAASLTAGAIAQPGQAQTAVSIQYLGHSCFLFSGDGRRILVNPFRPIGCTAGYRRPNVSADIVMISSRLFDEGSVEGLPGNPRLLSEPGAYNIGNLNVQGIRTAHDRNGGRRFGVNVVWKWTMGGMNIAHMGGAAAPIDVEQQILIGRPDVLLVPVGGGPKAYTPDEARQAIQTLNPRIVIPTQFRTSAADANACDIQPLDDFLTVMSGTPVQQRGSSFSLSRSSLPNSGLRIDVMSYS